MILKFILSQCQQKMSSSYLLTLSPSQSFIFGYKSLLSKNKESPPSLPSIYRGRSRSNSNKKVTFLTFLNTEHPVHNEDLFKVKSFKDLKRPRTAYNFFCAMNQQLGKENGHFSYKTLGKELGKLWSNLDESEKEKYFRLARNHKKTWCEYNKKLSK